MEETDHILEAEILEAEQEVSGSGDPEEDLVIADVIREESPAADPTLALKPVIEAAVYITDEPLTAEQIASAVEQPVAVVKEILSQLVTEYARPERGLSIRELA